MAIYSKTFSQELEWLADDKANDLIIKTTKLFGITIYKGTFRHNHTNVQASTNNVGFKKQ